MSLKHAAFGALDRGSTRWLMGLAASAAATTEGERAWINYDSPTGAEDPRPWAADYLIASR